MDAGLRFVAVAEIAHAQRRAVGFEQRLIVERGHVRRLRAGKTPAQRRRGPEKVEDQPTEAAEVTHQSEIFARAKLIFGAGVPTKFPVYRPEDPGQRVVEVQTGDGLHGAAVTITQTAPVDRLHAADIRVPVARERNVPVRGNPARHAGGPQQLAADTGRREAMDIGERVQHFPAARVCRGHELEQGLGKIRRNETATERGAERRGMRGGREPAIGPDSQRLFLDTLAPARQHLRAGRNEPFEARFEGRGHPISSGSWHRHRVIVPSRTRSLLDTLTHAPHNGPDPAAEMAPFVP